MGRDYLRLMAVPSAAGLRSALKRGTSRLIETCLLRTPVNRSKLCPKGLSEHYTIEAENRAKYPLLRRNGKLERVSWDDALSAMAERFSTVQATYGKDALGRYRDRAVGHRRVLHTRKARPAGLRHECNYDSNTTLCMATAAWRATSYLSAATDLPGITKTSRRP